MGAVLSTIGAASVIPAGAIYRFCPVEWFPMLFSGRNRSLKPHNSLPTDCSLPAHNSLSADKFP